MNGPHFLLYSGQTPFNLQALRKFIKVNQKSDISNIEKLLTNLYCIFKAITEKPFLTVSSTEKTSMMRFLR